MAFSELNLEGLKELQKRLSSGALGPPYSREALKSIIAGDCVASIQSELLALAGEGMSPSLIARCLDHVIVEREARVKAEHSVEIVWTQAIAEAASSESQKLNFKDTSTVVDRLIREARSELILVSYSLDWKNAARIFQSLAEKHDLNAGFALKLFINISRGPGQSAQESLAEEARWFREEAWPGSRMPEIYYFPEAMNIEGATRACLHAKILIADRRTMLLTSANFTEAAHKRNIEAGALVKTESLARQVCEKLEELVKSGKLARVVI